MKAKTVKADEFKVGLKIQSHMRRNTNPEIYEVVEIDRESKIRIRIKDSQGIKKWNNHPLGRFVLAKADSEITGNVGT